MSVTKAVVSVKCEYCYLRGREEEHPSREGMARVRVDTPDGTRAMDMDICAICADHVKVTVSHTP